MENHTRNFDLASFKKAKDGMISTNRNSHKENYWSRKIAGRNYSLKEIEEIISSNSLNEQLRLSRHFFAKGGFYKRLITYYATLLKYTGILIPNPGFGKDLSTSHIQKRYYNAQDFIERLNLPIKLTEFSQKVLVEGGYFGVFTTLDKNKIAILDLPIDWCRTRFKDLEGNDIIEFDLSYFNTIINKDELKSELDAYPKFISTAYKNWTKGKILSSWIFIPADLGICFSFFDNSPFFLSVIPTTIQYDDSVETELKRDAEEIRKILVQKIPHLTDGRLLFEPDEAAEMHSGAVGMLKSNGNVSVLTTYADVDAIVSKTSSDAVSNNLEKMKQNIYNAAGTSAELFSSTGSATLEASIDNDMALMMILANKYSMFITKMVNRLYSNSNINFKYTILPITYYNQLKFTDTSFKLASSGYSYLYPGLSMGLSQKDLGNIKDLENSILNLGDKLIPLTSAYTQSGAEENGRPKKEQQEKNPKTIQNEESLDNQTGGDSK